MAQKERLSFLFRAYLDKEYSPAEKQELMEYARRAEDDDHIRDLINATLETDFLMHAQDEVQAEAIFRSIIAHKETRLSLIRKLTWIKIAAAAVIVLALGVGFYFTQSKNEKPVIADTKPLQNDVRAPEAVKAMITLADGRTVALDKMASGQLAMQGDVSVLKNAVGEVIYSSGSRVSARELQYNTLTNPRGSQVVNLTLADGTRVWLNAESSLKYPVAFVGNDRKVEITGEAYFEVTRSVTASGKKQSFLVDANGVITEVLGTHFNVNAYKDEGAMKITLLEGSVRVSKSNDAKTIKPGQQAIATGSELRVANNIDTDAVMAWKNGKFSFNRAEITTVMRELARWYNLEVVYQGGVPADKFGGNIQRTLPLSQVLDLLKESQVNFEIHGRKVIVKK